MMNETSNERELESRLDRAVHAASAQAVDKNAAAAAVERAWERVSEEVASDAASVATYDRETACVGFQAQLEDARGGRLEPAQDLLLKDHLTSCPECRRAASSARVGEPVSAEAKVIPHPGLNAAPKRRWSARWAVAAALIVALGLTAAGAFGYLPIGASPVMAEVAEVDGALYLLEGGATVPLSVGEAVRAGEDLRTSRGGTSLLVMPDGSTVELSERSAVTLNRAPGTTRVGLDRGDVIVHAADQKDGQLIVVTNDAETVVKGTIFSVNHGVKGTRVSVLQGEVVVEGDGDPQTLGPGQQMVTRTGLEHVELGDAFAWSRDADEYAELAGQLAQLERDVNELLMPGERHHSRLLGLVPPETAVYVALPNLGQALSESHALLDARMAESDVLRTWWQATIGGTGADDELAEAIAQIGALSEHLGDEIVVSLRAGSEGAFETPLLLAETTDRAALLDEIDRLLQETNALAEGDGASLYIVDENWDLAASPDEVHLYLWLDQDTLAASPSVEPVLAARDRATVESAQIPQTSPFLDRVGEAYEQGVDWLIAVDLERAIAQVAVDTGAHGEDGDHVLEGMQHLGIAGAEALIVTRELRGDRDETEAELLFDGPRDGAAAWLAEPGPMGSLRFIAPDAYAAAAFVIGDPALAVDELFAFARDSDPDAWMEWEQEADRAGADVLAEVAASLGGEIAVAIDGPLLPEPNVKLIAEVDDPDRLQQSVVAAVAVVSEELADSDHGAVSLTEETARGTTFHTVAGTDLDAEVCYAFANGYVVVARSCGHVERALQYERSGVNLASAAEFRELLPGGGHLGFSAVAYQQLGDTLGSLAGLAAGSGGLSADQSRALEDATSSLSASLSYAYAEDDRIRVAHTASGGMPWLSLFAILGEGGW